MKQNYFWMRTLALCLGFTLIAWGRLRAQPVTQTYTFTGATQSLVIPACVNDVTITARGAQGGSAGYPGADGGEVFGVLAVTSGQVLYINVGGEGGVTNGGFNGGGAGGVSASSSGAGGGGASDVRLNGNAISDRVLVAGGGGGSGGSNTYNATGGDGGGGNPFTSGNGYGGGATNGCAIGSAGGDTGGSGPGYGSGGGGGGLNSGGGGGGQPSASTGGYGCDGTPGNGGAGGGTSFICGGATGGQNGGGGGGGGYYGGGGGMTGTGGCNGGGGGGSSWTDPNLVSSPSFTGGSWSGNGEVIISYVYAGSQVAITPSDPVICPGASVTFTASGTLSYTWNSTGPQTNTFHTNPGSTTSYTLEGTNSIGCISKEIVTVTVKPLPVVSAIVSPTLVCVGGSATLTALGADTYSWSTGAITETIVVNPAVSVTYSLTGTSTVGIGCVKTEPVTVQVNTLNLQLVSDTSICSGEPLTLTGTGLTSYNWNTGLPFAQLTVTLTSNASYTLSGTDANNCSHEASVNVTIKQKPTVAASVKRAPVCVGEKIELSAAGADSYLWNTGSPNADIAVIATIDLPYNFTVTGTGSNGCSSSDVISVPVSKCSGLEESSTVSGIAVYPNPGSGRYIVETAGTSGYTIEVFDLVGKIVQAQNSAGSRTIVDMGDLPRGIYYFRIKSEHQQEVVKVLRQ